MSYTIGKGSRISMGCKFNGSGLLSIGENTIVNECCRLDNRASIMIGSNVTISAEVKLLTADHDMNHPQCKGRERGIVIEDFVLVGPDAMVLGGAQLRRGSVLGANSLLTKSTEAFGIYGGLPAVYQNHRQFNS
ncbi:acyltransferase [uncultured Hymenobacter sp.]|uniref:acyltransferase n=1 Tax=uncultured Hymenobacter sp. TaxID=170016 RepID=UPI0035CA8538